MARHALRVAAVGGAGPDVAWQRYTHPDRWAGWAPQIRSVEHDGAEDAAIRPGSRGVVHGPLGVQVRFVVDDVDDDSRTWAWTVAVGPLQVSMRHGAHPCSGGSLAWAEVGGPRWLARLYGPVARLALHRLVRA